MAHEEYKTMESSRFFYLFETRKTVINDGLVYELFPVSKKHSDLQISGF